MADLRIEALDYARKLTAALEQGAAGDAAQVNRLEAHLTEARDELAYAYDIIKNRNMRRPDSSYKTDLLNEIASLVDRDVRREIGADHAETKQQLAVALDRVHQLEQTHDQQVAALTAARNNFDALCRDLSQAQWDASMKQHTIEVLRGRIYDLEQTIAKAAPVESDKKLADALKVRLAEANDTITKQAAVIKELHKLYHELEARKMATQYDLDRAKEEIEFAEAEAAKYRPLIEAVRAGHVYAAFGEWVVPDVAENERNSIRIHFNLGDKQCL